MTGDLAKLMGLTILVVDDSDSIRDLVCEVLQREGAQCDVAMNGVQALEILRANPKKFDCVMMDVQMPIMDGLTATRTLRAMGSFEKLPVLAMTAGLLAEQQARARQAGMTDLVAKPIDFKQMIHQILMAVGRSSQAMELSANDVSDSIPVIDQVDSNHVNRTMDGNRALFDRLSEVFIYEFEGLIPRVKSSLALPLNTSSIKESARLIHSLCGAASQLGALQVSRDALALEQALEHATFEPTQAVIASLDRLAQSLHSLLDSLKRHLKYL